MINGQLQYHFGILDPNSLSDEEWAQKFAVLQAVRKKEAEESIKKQLPGTGQNGKR